MRVRYVKPYVVEKGIQENRVGSMKDFVELIRQLSVEIAIESRQGGNWERHAWRLARDRIRDPEAFLEWAKRNRHVSFTMAEVMTEGPRGPIDLARRLLVAILGRLHEDQLESAAQPL